MLAEQAAFYQAVAPEYEDHAIPGAWGEDVGSALEALRPRGAVLELACGPGGWTSQLLKHAESVTAIDASAEMIAIATSRVRDPRVRFVRANIFEWKPDRRYDVVFFGFWLSHVPLECFETFWSLVRDCLQPRGRVFFVDDAHRTPDELIYGESSTIVRRRLHSGDSYDVVKVPHTPQELEQRLARLGWRFSVRSGGDPFYWGAGERG